jgi:hypothetical protein
MPAWDEDAAKYFGENQEARDAFNRYMTDVNQPYVTKLEEGTKDARELWQDLNNDPAATVRELYATVYQDAPEMVEKYDALFTPAEEAAIADAAETAPAQRSDEEEALLEWARSKRDYETWKAGLKESHGLSDVDLGLIDPFVVMHNSDADEAVAALRAYQAAFLSAHGVEPTAATAATAPPALDGSGTAPVTPPAKTEFTKYGDLGNALRHYQEVQRASATPPPVL